MNKILSVNKCVGDDIISVWNVKDQLSNNDRAHKRKVKAHIRSVGVKPAALLHYTTQDVDYINMGTNKGKSKAKENLEKSRKMWPYLKPIFCNALNIITSLK